MTAAEPLRRYAAAAELARIQHLTAFNVAGAVTRQRLNQHATQYTFADGSYLLLRTTARRADAWHPAWRATANDIHLGPIQGAAICINRSATA